MNSKVRILALVLILGFAHRAWAQVADPPPSPELAYEGRLTESNALVTGTRPFVFSIVDSNGNELWNSGPQTLTVTAGLYAVVLGATGMPAIPASLTLKANLHLHVLADGVALSPNISLVPALQASTAWSVIGPFFGDISGTQQGISVDKLKGTPIDMTGGASAGQVLTFNGTSWTASAPTGGTGSGVQGPAGPPGIPGPVGPMGLTGTSGASGVNGANGTAGVDGKTILNGAVDPTTTVGVDGDFYLNTATSTIFGPRASGAWPAGVSLLNGPPGATGAQGPLGSMGPQGVMGLAGLAGSNGANGSNGTAGADGKTILNGAVDPTTTVGVDGDFYLNTATSTIFGPRASGAWPAGVSLQGVQGLAGSQGIQGSMGLAGLAGSNGANGTNGSNGTAGADGKTILNGAVDPTTAVGADGDFYLNTATSTIFGPRASGAWPAGVSLQGAQGLAGGQGIQGSIGLAGLAGSNGANGTNGADGVSPFTLDGANAVFTTGSLGVGIDPPSTTALLDLTSTTKGLLAPRMTTIQRLAIATPANGLIVFDTDTKSLQVYDAVGAVWNQLANATSVVAGVTSVGTTGPLTGGPITSTGSLGIRQAGTTQDGYLAHADFLSFLTAFSWGNHAIAGYLKADGSVPVTGSLNLGSNIISNLGGPVAATDAANKTYVDSIAEGLLWKSAVINLLVTPPGSPADGDRYIVLPSATGAWAGENNTIAQWSAGSSTWSFEAPVNSESVFASVPKNGYVFLTTNNAWVQFNGGANYVFGGGLAFSAPNVSIANGGVTTTMLANGSVTGSALNSLGATSGQVMTFNGSVWAPATSSAGTVSAVTGTSPITVATGTTIPVIGLGTVPVTDGGTGAVSAAAAITNLLPSQTGNVGKILATDGTNPLWSAASLGTVTSVTGTSPITVATGTTTPAITLGTVPVANGGTGNTSLTGFLVGNGTGPFGSLSAIPGAAVSGDITGNAANVTGTVAVANGGTGASTLTAGQVLFGNDTSAVNNSANLFWDNTNNLLNVSGGLQLGNYTFATPVAGTLRWNGTALQLFSSGAWNTIGAGNGSVTSVTGNAPISVATGTSTPVITLGTVPVASGGTGATSLTGYLLGAGTSAVTASATIPGTVITGDITGNAANITGTVAITNGGTGGATPTAALTNLLPPQATNAGKFLTTSGAVTSWSLGATGTVTSVTGTSPIVVATGTTTPAITLGTVPVSNGGTGATTLTGYLLGSGTSALTATPTIPITSGGTGAATPTAAITALLPSQTGLPGTVLTTNGTVASWNATSTGTVTSVTGTSPIIVATGTTTPAITLGTVPVANGGTGATTLTGYILGSGNAPLAASATIPSTAITGIHTVPQGGTGVGILTGYVLASGTANMTATPIIPVSAGGTGGTTATTAINALLPPQASNPGQMLSTNGTVVSWTPASSGTVTSVTALSPLGVTSGLTTPVVSLAAAVPVNLGGTGTTSLSGYLIANGSISPVTSSTTIPSTAITGIHTVPQGGTGAGTLTGYVLASGTASMTATPIIPVSAGGTGLSTVTAGAIVFGKTTTALDTDPGNLFWDSSLNRLGVNTTTPRAIVDIEGGVTQSTGGSFANVAQGLAYNNNNGATTANYGLYVANRILSGELDALSDVRIKNVIGLSNAASDLETLKKLKITDYKYIDVVERGSQAKKGVIAQELERVYPNAVRITSGFIPSVYAIASAAIYNRAAQEVTVTLLEAHGFAVGDLVRIVDDAGNVDKPVSEVLGNNTFVLSGVEKAPTGQVFVYGKQVDDLHAVDYDQLFSMNISATQRLASDNEALKAQVAAMSAENQTLTARFAALEAAVAALQQK